MIAEVTELTKWGIPGTIIISLAGYILLIEKRHREERDEWRKATEKMQDKSNEIFRENTGILSSLKTILENRR